MTSILAFAGMAIAFIMLGTQCEKTNQAKREYKARMKDLAQKEKATKFSDKRKEKRINAQDEIDQARTETMSDPSDDSKKEDFIEKYRSQYK